VSLYQRNSQIGADFIASSMQENFFSVFSIASLVKKILATHTKLFRFIQFFFQKLCIGIDLIDTFLSIASHLLTIIQGGQNDKFFCFQPIFQFYNPKLWNVFYLQLQTSPNPRLPGWSQVFWIRLIARKGGCAWLLICLHQRKKKAGRGYQRGGGHPVHSPPIGWLQ
jgi:hypothetical protein